MGEHHDRRQQMVESQLIPRGIRDPALLDAFRTVPRHLFVPKNLWHLAYRDGALPIGDGQTISQPYMVAVMVQSAAIHSSSKVLEIGTGSGYEAAILAEIADQVLTIERIAELSENASRMLLDLGYRNIRLRVGDGTLGWPEEAPFDAILVSAGAPEMPPPLREQLRVGGRIVVPIQRGTFQVLHLVRRTASGFHTTDLDSCTFVPLIGEWGWAE